MEIPYDESKKDRDKIIKEREKKLYQSFENMRKQIDEKIQTMNFSTVSEMVKRQQLEEIRNELQKHLQEHYNALESGLKDDMVKVGESVLKESESFYAGLKMPIGMRITSFPVEIMNNVVNGSVYDEKWYLSKALWGDYTEKIDQINEVVSNGIGLNLSSFEIAKQLEQYVDPSAMTPSKTIVTHCLQDSVTGKLYSQDYVKRHPEKDWSGFKEKDSRFRYGKVDYNAQRLARTLVSHAYQQNVVQQAKANPFATGVKWLASGGERMCEICEERDGKIFPVDDVPLDHPNGMCTFEVVTDLSMMEMSDVLADWANGEPTEYDDALYAWYNDRAETPIERVPDMFAQIYNSEKVAGQIRETYGTTEDEYWSRKATRDRLEDIKQETGFDDDKAKLVLQYMCGDSEIYQKSDGEVEPECWFYKADTRIRNLDGEHWSDAAKNIDNYIVAARKYGGEIYRGLSLTDEQLEEIAYGGGKFLEKGALSSWSSSLEAAESFAYGDNKDKYESFDKHGVVLKIVDHPYAVPVSHLSIYGDEEDEVLVSNMHGDEYSILNIDYDEDSDVTYITLKFGG